MDSPHSVPAPQFAQTPRLMPAWRLMLALFALFNTAECREREVQDDASPARKARKSNVATNGEEQNPVRIIYPSTPGSFVELAADLRPSVVHLSSSRRVSGGPATVFPGGADAYSLGTGFIIDTDGFILTADHVVKSAPEIRVDLPNGAQVVATVIGRDPAIDIALLQIDASPELRPVRLGNSSQLEVGEWVVAMGNAFGGELSLSAGIVSALGSASSDGLTGGSADRFRAYLRTDARISALNSGGPLVNTAGDVIGINLATKARETGINLAVPIDRVRPLLPMLKKDHVVTRPFLGIQVHPVTKQVAIERGLPVVSGVLISKVFPGSPAARGGLRAGDVVLEYDQKKIDHRSFPWLLASSGINRRIEVVVWRAGAKHTLGITPERRPD